MTGSPYYEKNKEAAENYRIDQKGMVWERSSTDTCCCAVFVFFLFGMVVISGIGLS